MEINMLQALQVESTSSTKEVQLLLYGEAEQNAQAKPFALGGKEYHIQLKQYIRNFIFFARGLKSHSYLVLIPESALASQRT